MTAAKTETDAEKYRRIKAEREQGQQLFALKTPSGMTWQLRRPNLAQFMVSGVMPISLAGKFAASAEAMEAATAMSLNDQIKTVEFSASLVRYCAVSPRIVEHPTEPNDIGFDEVELDDFQAILAWAMQGGESGTPLTNFRKKRK